MAKYKIIPSSRTIVQSPISIGHKAEKGVEAIEFDLTAWVETYGSGTLTVIMRRWGDAIPYPIALEIDENNKATWTLSDTDTAKAGMAYAQLSYIVGDEVVKKSDIYTFRVMDSLTGEGDPPEAYESWLEHLTHLAAEAMAGVLDIEGIVTDKTLTVDGGIADAKATGDALSALEDAVTEETDKLKADLNYIQSTLVCKKTEIEKASIDASGNVVSVNDRKLVCFAVEAGHRITVSGTYDLYGFFTQEPSKTSVTYNSSRTLGSSISKLTVPSGCKWVGIRTLLANDNLEINSNIDKLHDELNDVSTGLVTTNSYDYMMDFSPSNKSTDNISVTWDGDTATINGTPRTTAESINNYYASTSELPFNMKAGQKIYFKVSTSNDFARLMIQPYNSSGAMTPSFFTDDGSYTIPSEAVGIVLRLGLETNKSFSNDTFKAHIYNAETNADISDTLNTVESMLNKYNSIELLSDAAPSNKTTANITITWSERTATITGNTEAVADTIVNYYHNATALPEGFKAGKTVYFEVSTSNEYARLGFITYDSNGASLGSSYFSKDGVYTIPSAAVGMTVRLALVINKSFSNDTFTAHIYNAPSNLTIEGLLDRMSLAEARIGKETKTPMLTIIDDDGNAKFYTDLYPLVSSKKVSIAPAIPYAKIGTSGHLSLEQVQEMYANGTEILNHSYAHNVDYSAWTERDFEEDYRKAKNSYAMIGIPTNIIIYVGSSGTKAEAVEAAKRVFDGGINSGNQHINYCTGNRYLIERYGIADSNDGGRINGYELSQLTDLIDSLKANGGWMVWMLHTSSNYWNNTMLSNIASAIDYAISENVPIVSAECGFRTYFGN